MSKKRASRGKGPGYLCWQCGQPMKKRDLVCKPCRETKPAAVKAQLAVLRKSFGGRVQPVAAPAGKTIVKAAASRPQTADDIRREALIASLAGCTSPSTSPSSARAAGTSSIRR